MRVYGYLCAENVLANLIINLCKILFMRQNVHAVFRLQLGVRVKNCKYVAILVEKASYVLKEFVTYVSSFSCIHELSL